MRTVCVGGKWSRSAKSMLNDVAFFRQIMGTSAKNRAVSMMQCAQVMHFPRGDAVWWVVAEDGRTENQG